MKFYAIPPNKDLDLMHEGDSYFCLAHHYLADTQYKAYFLDLRTNNPDAFILLDNGAAEDSTVTEDQLIEVVKELKPNEVIAPDVLFDRDQTLKNLYSFVNKMDNEGLRSHTKLFGCPQGSTKSEWLDCYYKMLLTGEIDTIGLSKIAVPKAWNNATGDKKIAESRNKCVSELSERGYLVKPIHLLGMGEHDEFDFYLENKFSHIRSSDSCYTVLAAINGIDFENGDTTRIPTTNAYFDVKLSEDQIKLAKKNINYLKTKYSKI